MKNFKSLAILGSFLACTCSGCFDPNDYTKPYPADKQIKFISADNQSVLADGVNAADVQVSISTEAAFDKRYVIFKTNSGFFLGSKKNTDTVEADDTFKALAQLANPNATTATVSAFILKAKATTDRKVIFTRAYPTKIFVSVDSFAIASNYSGEVVLKATLRTDNGGIPSVGQIVRFRVVKEKITNGDFGDFLNKQTTAQTDASGIAHIRYSPGKANYEGYATIIASTDKSATPKDTISNTSRIFIRK